ncbi:MULTISPECIES: hypothetical protein [unclassified Streptomyces]|uniref:hypothetical protein n=1 Tax=unclassified Streptomyces TaxID=2593676 RepID=UPI00093D6B91|nr:hypothetical protein [Streptomyces sp. TSRI0107]OKJ87963.1 hypothetical protein AMK31_12600 [Streptomyces sp. TSRI0107]
MSRSAVAATRLLGVGLTTAVAVGLAAAPASAAPDVPPIFIEGNPALTCPAGGEGLRVPPTDAEYEVELENGETGVLNVDISDDGTLLTFSIDLGGEIAVRSVTVKGGPNANRYVYDAANGFPNGTTGDDDLVSPLNPGGNIPEISHIDFCFIPSDYDNGNGNGGGTA